MVMRKVMVDGWLNGSRTGNLSNVAFTNNNPRDNKHFAKRYILHSGKNTGISQIAEVMVGLWAGDGQVITNGQ